MQDEAGNNILDIDGNVQYVAKDDVGLQYQMFQHVHVMIFVGFGYLMTCLRKVLFLGRFSPRVVVMEFRG